jgi:hypothetical protein
VIIVDAPQERGWRLGPNSHLISTLAGSEGTVELIEFAKRLGLKTGWIQKQGTSYEHFDLTRSRYAAAIAAGAKLVDRREFVAALRAKRA